jgi:hypothetical protein
VEFRKSSRKAKFSVLSDVLLTVRLSATWVKTTIFKWNKGTQQQRQGQQQIPFGDDKQKNTIGRPRVRMAGIISNTAASASMRQHG